MSMKNKDATVLHPFVKWAQDTRFLYLSFETPPPSQTDLHTDVSRDSFSFSVTCEDSRYECSLLFYASIDVSVPVFDQFGPCYRVRLQKEGAATAIWPRLLRGQDTDWRLLCDWEKWATVQISDTEELESLDPMCPLYRSLADFPSKAVAWAIQFPPRKRKPALKFLCKVRPGLIDNREINYFTRVYRRLQSVVPPVHIPQNYRHTYVYKWTRVTEETGLVYLMTSGAVGWNFRPNLKTVVNSSRTLARLIGIGHITTFVTSTCPEDLKNTIAIMYQYADLLLPVPGPVPEPGFEPLVYVTDYFSNEYGVALLLSTGVVQIAFNDETQFIVENSSLELVYIGKKGIRQKVKLSDILKLDDHLIIAKVQEMAKMLRELQQAHDVREKAESDALKI